MALPETFVLTLPPLIPLTDTRSGISLSEQVRRLGDAGFPVVFLQGEALEGEILWPEFRVSLQASAENGGWPLVGVQGHPALAERAHRDGFTPWESGLMGDPSAVAPLTTIEPRLKALEAGFRTGAASLWVTAEAAGLEAPSDLLWQAQCLRWSIRPPFDRGQGVALVGGSGCGKSTLAKKLGARLALPVQDVDELIVQQAGKSIPRIFAEDGEDAFRRLEAEATCQALQSPAVLALGGGAWESEDVRTAAKAAGYAVLWIAEHPGRVWERVARDPGRPLAQEQKAFLERWRSRMPRWCEADMVLPLGRSAGKLAEALVNPVAMAG